MSDKPADPGRDDTRTVRADSPPRSEKDFRSLCQRYSRLRGTLPR
jgi:hypothetical protein